MKKGFTLIELMVVISMIAILTTVILVAIGSVRSKAKDTKTKTIMLQVREAAQNYYGLKKTYPPECQYGNITGLPTLLCNSSSYYTVGGVVDPDLKNIADLANEHLKETGTTDYTKAGLAIYSNGKNYALAMKLPSSKGESWPSGGPVFTVTDDLWYCMDSTGVKGTVRRVLADRTTGIMPTNFDYELFTYLKKKYACPPEYFGSTPDLIKDQ